MAAVHPLPIPPSAKPVLVPPNSAQTQQVKTKKRMWSRLWPWLMSAVAATGIAALIWIYGAPLVLGPVVTVSPVIRTNLLQTLVASGHIETPFRVTVSSRIAGVVAKIPVSEGDTVAAGDTLIILDATKRAPMCCKPKVKSLKPKHGRGKSQN
jgi:biotin carboxyl carrier protein